MRGELVDRKAAEDLIFRLAREHRDKWLNWPKHVAAVVSADISKKLGVALDPQILCEILEVQVRLHLLEMSGGRLKLSG